MPSSVSGPERHPAASPSSVLLDLRIFAVSPGRHVFPVDHVDLNLCHGALTFASAVFDLVEVPRAPPVCLLAIVAFVGGALLQHEDLLRAVSLVVPWLDVEVLNLGVLPVHATLLLSRIPRIFVGPWVRAA